MFAHEMFWRRGLLWNMVQGGVITGLGFGLLWFATEGSWDIGMSVTGVCVGVFLAFTRWRSWPAAKSWRPAQRAAIARSVHRGEAPEDPRLAPGVLDFAAAIRRNVQRLRVRRWRVLLLASIIFGVAIVTSVAESGREAVVVAACAALWALDVLVWTPRYFRRALERVSLAETAAQRQLRAQQDEQPLPVG